MDTGEEELVIQSAFQAQEHFAPNAITLTIQADIKRINRGVLNRIAQQWRGPISVAVLSPSNTAIQDHFASKANDAVKQYATVHSIVRKSWRHYPINRMRNHAIRGVQTDYFMVMDSDEDLPYPMSYHMDQILKARQLFPETHSVFIVTSWQFSISDPPNAMPKDLHELKSWVEKGHASFKIPYYAPAYKCLEFSEFVNLDEAVEVPYKDSFEPYFIAKTGAIPLFDERFEGWGGDKNSLFLRLGLENYHLVALPKVFTWTREPSSAGMVHPPFADPDLKPRVWHELGHQHGCDRCEPKKCVDQCPALFNHHLTHKNKVKTVSVSNTNQIQQEGSNLEQNQQSQQKPQPQQQQEQQMQQPAQPPAVAAQPPQQELAPPQPQQQQQQETIAVPTTSTTETIATSATTTTETTTSSASTTVAVAPATPTADTAATVTATTTATTATVTIPPATKQAASAGEAQATAPAQVQAEAPKQ